MIDLNNVEEAFTPQQATPEMLHAMEKINHAALNLAQEILYYVPKGADQQAAVRKVREAAMTANKGVVTEGRL